MDEPNVSQDGHTCSASAAAERSTLWHVQAETILERITDGFVALDKQWRYIYINHQAELRLGIRREDLLGKNVWGVRPEAVGTRFYHNCHAAMNTQQPLTLDEFYLSSQRWYTLKIFPSPEGLSIFSTDNSQRKQFEQRLLFLASIAQSISDAVIATDMQSTILCWNKAAEALYGWTQEEVLGKYAPDIIAYEFPNNPPNEWQEHVIDRGYWKGEVIHRRKDGISLHLLASVSLVKDSKGTILGMVAANRDISAWKELERRKDEFIEIASHELHTPLSALKGYAQLLQRKFIRQDSREYADILTRIDGQVNRMTNLISDLIAASKMQVGKVAFSDAAFDFDAWIQHLIDDLQLRCAQHTIICTGAAEGKVVGDQDRLAQVFVTLITNAIKYSPDAMRVDVEIAVERDEVIVRVRDYGAGIPRAHRHKIFERFYRVTSLSNNTFPGLGHGLYMSHDIIHAHGGRIWVESEEGQGSSFIVSLPLVQEE